VAVDLSAPAIDGTVGVGYHTEKRKYLAQSAAGVVTTEDKLKTHVISIDADLILTKFMQVKGEYYTGTGTDDTYNGIATPASVFGAAGSRDTIDTSGFWAQGILKPLPIVWLTVGYGEATADKAQVTSATAREKNTQLAFGVIFNAGKAWRFGVEYIQTTTTYGAVPTGASDAEFSASQLAVSSMLRF
jgi:hypothetical protein